MGDLDLPDGDGFEVLKAMNAHPELRRKPVIVVSANPSPQTIDRCYELRARTFIPKPDNWDEFASTAEAITEYWFGTARCPTTTPFSEVDADATVEVE